MCMAQILLCTLLLELVQYSQGGWSIYKHHQTMSYVQMMWSALETHATWWCWPGGTHTLQEKIKSTLSKWFLLYPIFEKFTKVPYRVLFARSGLWWLVVITDILKASIKDPLLMCCIVAAYQDKHRWSNRPDCVKTTWFRSPFDQYCMYGT